MAIERLLEALEREAKAAAEAALARGRRDAEAIAEASARRRARRREQASGRTEATFRAEVESRLAVTRRRALEQSLTARRRFLERVRSATAARLADAGASPEYRATIPARMAEALSFAGDGAVEIRCAPAIAEDVRAALAGRAGTAVIEDAGIGAGFVLCAEGGALTVDATLETALARAWPALSVALVRRVEGGEEGTP